MSFVISAVILEADGKEHSRRSPQAGPPSPNVVPLGKSESVPSVPEPPLYGPPLSSCTPFESILAQEVLFSVSECVCVGVYVYVCVCVCMVMFVYLHVYVFLKSCFFSTSVLMILNCNLSTVKNSRRSGIETSLS